MVTLKERLSEWRKWDGAAFELAVSLGLLEDSTASFLTYKGIFWSAHPLGDALQVFLQELVRIGVLEYREEPDQEYRWKGCPF